MQPIFANVIQDAFSPLISVFKAIMVFLHGNVTVGSWGLSIIGLTIVVRAALVPLTVKQFSSMAKLQALGPEIKALQARYKDDKQRLNEEMMKFYRENQVNPFSSCLPLVLQFPVFISLFYMLRTDLKLQICGNALKAHGITATSVIQKTSCQSVAPGSGKFLFIPDITASAHGVVLIVLIVLYIGSQLVSSLLTTATIDRNQRLLMLGLPFMFTFFIIGFPAGLILYWITTNLWTVGQQYIVRRYRPPPVVVDADPGAGKLSLGSLFSRAPATNGGGAKESAAPVRGAGGAKAAARKGGSATAVKQSGEGPAPAGGGRRKGAAATPDAEERTAGKTAGKNGAPRPPGSAAKGRGAQAKATGRGSSGAGAGTKPAAPKASPAEPKSSESNGGPGGKRGGDAAGGAAPRARGSAPPPPPRKKKKRSGRRR